MHMFAAFYFVIILSLEQEWNFTYNELISLWTLGALLIGLGALPAGWLSDKWSRSFMMVIMFFGMGFSSILCVLSNEKFLLFLGLSLLGLSCCLSRLNRFTRAALRMGRLACFCRLKRWVSAVETLCSTISRVSIVRAKRC